jgi:ligand-binding sensor domain-containing protein
MESFITLNRLTWRRENVEFHVGADAEPTWLGSTRLGLAR